MAQYELTTKQKATLKKQGYVNIVRNGRTIRVTPSMVKGRQQAKAEDIYPYKTLNGRMMRSLDKTLEYPGSKATYNGKRYAIHKSNLSKKEAEKLAKMINDYSPFGAAALQTNPHTWAVGIRQWKDNAKVDQGEIRKISYDAISPPLNPSNWTLDGTFKFEKSGGTWFNNAPKGHWMRDIPLQEGIFTNTAHPRELVRISGSYSEFAVYLFKR